jgi:hypothetical protein
VVTYGGASAPPHIANFILPFTFAERFNWTTWFPMELPRNWISHVKNRISLNVFACKPPEMKILGTVPKQCERMVLVGMEVEIRHQ